jgi:uncharacterized membrane protein YccC
VCDIKHLEYDQLSSPSEQHRALTKDGAGLIHWRDIQRFLYSHYLLTGVRQAVGALTPAVVIVASGHSYSAGLTMSIGALCVAIVDQAAGGQPQTRNAMLLAMSFSVVSAFITGLVSAHSLLMWMVVPVLAFLFSMLAVYGVRGGLLGFVSLLIMTLTMRAPMTLSEVFAYSGYLLGGGGFYFFYSLVVRRFFRAREARETLAAAFFSMADYLRSRAALYDNRQDLDVAYRGLIRAQSAVVDAVQTLDHDRCPAILVNTLQRLLTNFVDTRTDFSSIRNGLHEPPVLHAMYDTLTAMADQMVRLALNMARNRSTYAEPFASTSMEMIRRALQESSNGQYSPEKRNALLVLQQVYERFCRAQVMLDELAQHTSHRDSFSNAVAPGRPTSAYSRPLIAQERWRLGLYLGSLRLSAPSFRHALRLRISEMAGA